MLLFCLSDDSGDDFSPSSHPMLPGQGNASQNSEVQTALRTLGSKVEDLSTCNDLISKHGSALQRSVLLFLFAFALLNLFVFSFYFITYNISHIIITFC